MLVQVLNFTLDLSKIFMITDIDTSWSHFKISMIDKNDPLTITPDNYTLNRLIFKDHKLADVKTYKDAIDFMTDITKTDFNLDFIKSMDVYINYIKYDLNYDYETFKTILIDIATFPLNGNDTTRLLNPNHLENTYKCLHMAIRINALTNLHKNLKTEWLAFKKATEIKVIAF